MLFASLADAGLATVERSSQIICTKLENRYPDRPYYLHFTGFQNPGCVASLNYVSLVGRSCSTGIHLVLLERFMD